MRLERAQELLCDSALMDLRYCRKWRRSVGFRTLATSPAAFEAIWGHADSVSAGAPAESPQSPGGF